MLLAAPLGDVRQMPPRSIPALFMALCQPTPRVSSNPLSSFTPILPHELWSEIFQLATLIPDELEISHMFCPSVFGDQSGHRRQLAAWKEVLPLRVAIQSVSRLWHFIGVELLYQSFHDDSQRRSLQLLASTLRVKPSYGVLVKHLTLRLSMFNTINADAIFILRSCPNVLILSTKVSTTSIPEMFWDACSLLTSLRLLQVDVHYITDCPGALPPPVPVGPFILPNLRHFHLNSRFDRHGILTLERTLSLPRLTSLSLDLHAESPVPSLCKDLLRRLTHLKIKGRALLPYLFQAMEFPLLHIFQFDGCQTPQGTLLSECPNLPIQQIDILILTLPAFGITHPHILFSRFHEWWASVHCILTEARDPTLMPKLKRVILKEGSTPRIAPNDLFPSYGDLVSCYAPLADVFESRGVELSMRSRDGNWDWEVDVPIRDFILQTESRF